MVTMVHNVYMPIVYPRDVSFVPFAIGLRELKPQVFPARAFQRNTFHPLGPRRPVNLFSDDPAAAPRKISN